MIRHLVGGKPVAAFDGVDYVINFVLFEADDRLFVQFRRCNLGGIIDCNQSFIKKVLKKSPYRREFARLGAFVAVMLPPAIIIA